LLGEATHHSLNQDIISRHCSQPTRLFQGQDALHSPTADLYINGKSRAELPSLYETICLPLNRPYRRCLHPPPYENNPKRHLRRNQQCRRCLNPPFVGIRVRSESAIKGVANRILGRSSMNHSGGLLLVEMRVVEYCHHFMKGVPLQGSVLSRSKNAEPPSTQASFHFTMCWE